MFVGVEVESQVANNSSINAAESSDKYPLSDRTSLTSLTPSHLPSVPNPNSPTNTHPQEHTTYTYSNYPGVPFPHPDSRRYITPTNPSDEPTLKYDPNDWNTDAKLPTNNDHHNYRTLEQRHEERRIIRANTLRQHQANAAIIIDSKLTHSTPDPHTLLCPPPTGTSLENIANLRQPFNLEDIYQHVPAMRATYSPTLSLHDPSLQVHAARSDDVSAPTFTTDDVPVPTHLTDRTLGWVQQHRALLDSGTNIHIITPAKVRQLGLIPTQYKTPIKIQFGQGQITEATHFVILNWLGRAAIVQDAPSTLVSVSAIVNQGPLEVRYNRLGMSIIDRGAEDNLLLTNLTGQNKINKVKIKWRYKQLTDP